MVLAIVNTRPLLLFLRPPQAARVAQRLGPFRPLAPLRRVQRAAVGAHVLVGDFELLLVLFAAIALAVAVQQDGDARVASDERG